MKTTLNKILKHSPCCQDNDSGGWSLLLKNLNKTKPDDEPLELSYILKSNGIKDAIWALRCFDYMDYCLFLADIAESVLHIYENNNHDSASRNAINAIRFHKQGKVTKTELKDAAAVASSIAAAGAAADAADSAADSAAAAAVAAAADDARNRKWNEIEGLFVSHFCGDRS